MKRSLPARVAVSLLVCGLVGGTLAVLGGGNDSRRATVLTTSSQTLEGEFRGPAAGGILLDLEDGFEVVPWDVVSRVSFERASPHDAQSVVLAAAATTAGGSFGVGLERRAAPSQLP